MAEYQLTLHEQDGAIVFRSNESKCHDLEAFVPDQKDDEICKEITFDVALIMWIFNSQNAHGILSQAVDMFEQEVKKREQKERRDASKNLLLNK